MTVEILPFLVSMAVDDDDDDDEERTSTAEGGEEASADDDDGVPERQWQAGDSSPHAVPRDSSLDSQRTPPVPPSPPHSQPAPLSTCELTTNYTGKSNNYFMSDLVRV